MKTINVFFSWSTSQKNHLFSDNRKFNPEHFDAARESDFFLEKINQTFDSIGLKLQVIELYECPNIFVSYAASSFDWRKELGVPIV